MRNSAYRAAAVRAAMLAALTTLVFLVGTAAFTSERPPERAAEPAPERQRAAGDQPRLPTDAQLGRVATAALTDEGSLDEKGTFVLSAVGAIDGSGNRSEIAPGTRLFVEAACAGEGAVTLTVTSGEARTRQHLTCAEAPRAKTFTFTTHGDTVFFDADRAGAAARGSLAYLAHSRSTSERR